MSDGNLLDAVKRLQLAIRVTTDAAFSESGLTFTQASALTTLARTGPLPCSALARRLGITRQSMQELVTALHTEGLLAKQADANDARHILVELSGAGAKSARESSRVLRSVEARMTQGMSVAERGRFAAVLRTCLRGLDVVA